MSAKLYLSHHRVDAEYCWRLLDHLRPAHRQGLVYVWTSSEAAPGERSPRFVSANLENTDIVVLLLSPEFIEGHEFWSTTTCAAMERERAGRLRLVPVLLRACSWEEHLSGHQALHLDGVPLISGSPAERDARIATCARDLLRLAEAFVRPQAIEVGHVTSIGVINAQLAAIRVGAAGPGWRHGDIGALMRLKQALRYGELDESDPYKSTRPMPLPDLVQLVDSSEKELSGAPNREDWREARIAELEALLVERDLQRAELLGKTSPAAGAALPSLPSWLPYSLESAASGVISIADSIDPADSSNVGARLLLRSAGGEQRVRLRSGVPMTIGRGPENRLQLRDDLASRAHCVVEDPGGYFLLRDLDSMNGTFVNGRQINQPTTLCDGDAILVGSTVLRYEAGGSSSRRGPPAGG